MAKSRNQMEQLPPDVVKHHPDGDRARDADGNRLDGQGRPMLPEPESDAAGGATGSTEGDPT